MRKRRNPTKKEWLEAIEACYGVPTLVAEKLGLKRQAVYKRAKADPQIEAALESAQDRIIDLAEGHLVKDLSKGDQKAYLFVLKTLGKKRGYTERHEVSGPDGGPIEVTADELDRRIDRLASRLTESGDHGESNGQ